MPSTWLAIGLGKRRVCPQCYYIKENWGGGIDDTASYRVRYQSGALGTIVKSRCYTGHHQHFAAELYGSRAALRFGLEELYWFDRSSGRWIEVAVPEGFGRSMVTEFTDAIPGKQTEAATFEDGLHVQELLDAAIESSRCSREVSLSYFEELDALTEVTGSEATG